MSVYAKLDNTKPEIRVLVLLPSSNFAAPIECQLVHRALHDDSTKYEAISYVWGEPHFSQEIALNGESRLITRNLELALRYFRLSNEARTLWVDALCINQEDLSERSQQVTLMGEIYARCAVDLAWLLTPESDNDEVEDEAESFGNAMALLTKITMKDMETMASMREAYEKGRGWRSVGDEDIAYKGPQYILSHDDSLLLALAFDLAPIWNRVWTMQELSLAPRLILVAGHHQLDWEILASFLGDRLIADAFHAIFGHGIRVQLLDSTFGAVQKVDHQRRLLETKVYTSGFLDVLTRFQGNEATDLRDCIYGLLGLVSEPHYLQVDYTKSTEEVFRDATLCLLSSYQNLDPLCQTPFIQRELAEKQRKPDILRLPTWVPDYSRSASYDEHTRILFAQRGIYKAGRPSFLTPPICTSEGLLRLKAIRLGCLCSRITERGRQKVPWPRDWPQRPLPWEKVPGARIYLPNASGNLPSAWEQRPRAWLEKLSIESESLNQESDYMQTGEPALQAFWRTMVMDCRAYPIKRLAKDGISRLDQGDFMKMLTPRIDSTEFASTLSKMPQEIHTMWERTMAYWEFTVTDNHLYAMVKACEAGDIVASVEGAKVPLVLRPVEADRRIYSYVGTAYVHGFMDGEALDVVQRGELEEMDIFIE